MSLWVCWHYMLELAHHSFIYLLNLFFLRFVCFMVKYTVTVFRHTRRRGHRILLQVFVSHHVVAGIWTQDLRKSSQWVLLTAEPSLQPHHACFLLYSVCMLYMFTCVGCMCEDRRTLGLLFITHHLVLFEPGFLTEPGTYFCTLCVSYMHRGHGSFSLYCSNFSICAVK